MELTGVQNSGCGKGVQFMNKNLLQSGKIESDVRIKYSEIHSLMKVFQDKSEMFLKTGGVHSSAIVQKGKIISFMEDIGRHNAIDKVIGYILLKSHRCQGSE